MISECSQIAITVNDNGLTEIIKTSVTPLVAACGFGLAFWQYRKAQIWKESEFAAKEDQKIFSNDKLRYAIRFLDWSSFTFEIPSEYQVLAEEEMGRQYNKLFTHDWNKVAIAMKDKEDRGGRDYEWSEMMYREYFAELFDHFVEIRHYLDIPLCTPRDLHHTKYYLKKIDERLSNVAMLEKNNIDIRENCYGIFHKFWKKFYPHGEIHDLYEMLTEKSFNNHPFNEYK